MEAKDIALLGFVSAAKVYVDKHINDGTNLGDLKDVDITTLKNELSNQLKSFAVPEQNRNDLLLAGVKAFNEYAKELNKPKVNVIDQLGQIFDVSFEEYDTDTKQTKNDIDTYMNAYDLDEKVSIVKEEKPQNDDLDEFGLSADDDVLKAIASAAAKTDEELAREFANTGIAEPEDMDETYADVINNEEIVTNKEVIVESKTVKQNRYVPLSKSLKDIGKVEAPTVPDENKVSLSGLLKSIGEQEIFKVAYEEYVLEEDNNQVNPIVSNPGLDLALEQQKEDSLSYNDLVGEDETEIEEIEEDNTLSEALAGLSELQGKQASKPEPVKKDPNEVIYNNIMVAYPYLNKGFIKSAYEQKDALDNKYEEGRKYIILHRLSFEEIDKLHEFVEIMMSHNYLVNVDEKKMIVDTLKEVVNEQGLILTNILSIANQARILKGEYDGYRVIENEGK